MAQCGGGGTLSRRLHQETVESLCQGLLDLDDDKFSAMCSAFGYLQEWPDLSTTCGATNLGAPNPAAKEAGNGNDSSCGGGGRKRRPGVYFNAKVRDLCVYGACASLSARCILQCEFSFKSLLASVAKIDLGRTMAATCARDREGSSSCVISVRSQGQGKGSRRCPRQATRRRQRWRRRRPPARRRTTSTSGLAAARPRTATASPSGY